MTETKAQVEEAILATFEPSNYADASVVVAVPDATRDVDYQLLLTPLLEQLADAGADTTVMVALGLHRPMSAEERVPLEQACEPFGVDIVEHDAASEAIRTLADDVSGGRAGWPTLPARYPEQLAEADRIVCVGSVEPHQYAGFSGGIKTVAIGCAGKETIDAMHGLEFLRMPGTTVGRVDANPFNQALWELGETLPPADALMFVPAAFSSCHTVEFGPVRACYESCRNVAEQVFFRRYRELRDWFHLRVDGPKSVNFYQASRAATYAALVDQPALRPGGLIVLEAKCPEGVGQGPGERACADAMRRGVSELLDELDGTVTGTSAGGQQRAFVLARALRYCEICLVGAPPIDELEPMGIRQFDSVDAALDEIEPGPTGEMIDKPMFRIPQLTQTAQ